MGGDGQKVILFAVIETFGDGFRHFNDLPSTRTCSFGCSTAAQFYDQRVLSSYRIKTDKSLELVVVLQV